MIIVCVCVYIYIYILSNLELLIAHWDSFRFSTSTFYCSKNFLTPFYHGFHKRNSGDLQVSSILQFPVKTWFSKFCRYFTFLAHITFGKTSTQTVSSQEQLKYGKKYNVSVVQLHMTLSSLNPKLISISWILRYQIHSSFTNIFPSELISHFSDSSPESFIIFHHHIIVALCCVWWSIEWIKKPW